MTDPTGDTDASHPIPSQNALVPSAGNLPTTNQFGNEVQGHLAGRDVNPTYNVSITNQAPSPPARSVFRKLFDKLEQEAEADKTLTTYIRQLEIYTRPVENEQVIGLAGKLALANRARQADMAIALKENVYANLKANVFSPAYQLIIATLMSKIHERFETVIRPLIEGGADSAQVDLAFSTEITNPIANELDECPQFEDVAIDYVRGMAYFLTGNCHIRWD